VYQYILAFRFHVTTDRVVILQQALKSYAVVFDAVFVPRETRLLREAAACGATVIDGLEMLIRLVMVQFKLFTGGMTGTCRFIYHCPER
jgi:3-dehydroquinate dehydratase / shikimate dehydrogenase